MRAPELAGGGRREGKGKGGKERSRERKGRERWASWVDGRRQEQKTCGRNRPGLPGAGSSAFSVRIRADNKTPPLFFLDHLSLQLALPFPNTPLHPTIVYSAWDRPAADHPALLPCRGGAATAQRRVAISPPKPMLTMSLLLFLKSCLRKRVSSNVARRSPASTALPPARRGTRRLGCAQLRTRSACH